MLRSQEVVALRRRLARLQKDTSKQSARVEAAQGDRKMLQSVVCELTVEVERLGNVQNDLQDRVASAQAAREVVEVRGHHRIRPAPDCSLPSEATDFANSVGCVLRRVRSVSRRRRQTS